MRESPATPGTAPKLDLEATKSLARDLNRAPTRSPGVVPLGIAPPDDPKTKLGRAIEKAAQPDCRDAYAGLGLLAIPLLLKDTVTDTGCRW
jgi:hypothetical protein